MNLEYRVLLEQFKEWLEMRGLSARTIEEYPRDVKVFLCWLEKEGVLDVSEIRTQDLMGFQALLMKREWKGKPLSARTIKKRMEEVRGFFRFLIKTGKLIRDPSAHLELPKAPKSLPRLILEEWEMEAILEQTDAIIEAVNTVLEHTPAQLAADITEKGIVLIGGDALLTNMDRLLYSKINLPIKISEDPLSTVAMGAGEVIDSIEILKQVMVT